MVNSLEQCPRSGCNNEQEDAGVKMQAKDLWKKLMLQVHPHFFYDANVNNNSKEWQKRAGEMAKELQSIYQNKETTWQDKLDEFKRLEMSIVKREVSTDNKDLVGSGEFAGAYNDEEGRLSREMEDRKGSINEGAFAHALKKIKLKSELIEYISSLDGKRVAGEKFNSQAYIDNIEKVFSADLSIAELEPEFLREPIREIRRIELARLGTEFTLGKISDPYELNAATEKEGDEILKNKARELWNAFVVHKKNGDRYTDLDGKCSLGLFKEARVNFDLNADVKYVNPGDFSEGAVNLDTSGTHRVSVSGNWQESDPEDMTLYVDHHSEMTGDKTSGTQESYEFLISMGLLERTEQLDALVDFVTKIDNLTYPGMEKYFKNSYKTLAGLERFVQFEALMKFFEKKENRDNPYRELTRNEMIELGIIPHGSNSQTKNRSMEQEQCIVDSEKGLKELEKSGLIIETEKYGKIAINIGEYVPGGVVAAKASGYDAYMIWSPEKNSFFISTSVPIEDELPQGSKIRQRMWIKSINDGEELTVGLDEVIKIMAGNKLDAEKLKGILNKEKTHMGEMRRVDLYRQSAQATIDAIKAGPAKTRLALLNKYWAELKKEMETEGRIPKNKIERIIKMLKREIK